MGLGNAVPFHTRTGATAPSAVPAPLRTKPFETEYSAEADEVGNKAGPRLYWSPTPGSTVPPVHEAGETLTNSPPTNHAAE